MYEESKKEHWFKIIGIILATFIGAFLAFYAAVDITLHRFMEPTYNFRRMEKMMQKQQKNLEKMDARFMENPFEPKMAPMLVNLVKEANEYKIIVDLKPIGENEKNVNVKLDDNIVTVSGAIDKKEHHREDIMNFSQSYYLDEKLLPDKISKEKIGNKYIITIPFK